MNENQKGQEKKPNIQSEYSFTEKEKKNSLNTICFVPTQNVITILNVIKSK